MKNLKDLAEQAVVAYGATYLGALLADGFDLMDVSALKAAAVAALPAGLRVVYGALAGLAGDPRTASFSNPSTPRRGRS